MDFKFSNDSDNSQQEEAPGEQKKQRALLVLLLILVGGFTYIYFFTGLIKSQDAQKTAEAPVTAPQSVKIPLPARENEPAKPDAKTPKKVEAPKAPTPTVIPTAAATKSAPAASAKPADKKPQSTPDKKPDNSAGIKAETKKPAAEPKKSAVTDKKSVPVKPSVKKEATVVQTKPAAVVKSKKAGAESWSIVVGNYVLEEALSSDMGKVRKAGFEPIVKPSIRKRTKMNRLFASEFNDRAAAQSTLENLKRHTSDAFILDQGGKYAVYAGSYLQSESARSEKERLKAAGVTVTIKLSDIEIPSQSLSIGPFSSKKAADAAIGKIKSAGLKATISQK